ncbi:hypothetical protein [Streptomyces sp. NPDC054783]
MIRLVASHALDAGPERVRTFLLDSVNLDSVNDAAECAAAHGGPFDRTVLTPPAA